MNEHAEKANRVIDATSVGNGAVPVNLYRAMKEARKEMGTVPQSGHNKHDDYDYSKNEDFVATIEGPIDKHGMILRHDVIEEESLPPRKNWKGNEEQVRRVKIRTTAIHIESGESTWTEFACEGMDPRDKANLKANTGAKKYAIANLFNLKSGIDPETTSDGRNEAPRERRARPQGQPSGQSQSKPAGRVNVGAPAGWPESNNETINGWVSKLAGNTRAWHAALDLLKGNNSLYSCEADWLIVFAHFRSACRAKFEKTGIKDQAFLDAMKCEVERVDEIQQGRETFSKESTAATEAQHADAANSTA